MLINSDNRLSNDTFLFTKLIIVGIFNDEIYINIPNNLKWLNGEQRVCFKQLVQRINFSQAQKSFYFLKYI